MCKVYDKKKKTEKEWQGSHDKVTGGELSCPKPQDEAHSIYCSLEIIFQVKEQYFSNIN